MFSIYFHRTQRHHVVFTILPDQQGSVCMDLCRINKKIESMQKTTEV